MSLTVLSRTVDSATDKRFVLSNEQTAIVMDPATISGWTVLRIGIRYVIPDTGSNLTGSPNFCFGLSAAPTANFANGPLSSDCTHFVGMFQQSSTWTRGTNSYEDTTTVLTRRVGATIDAETDTDGLFVPHAEDTVRGGLIIRFDRSTPSLWDIRKLTASSDANCANDVTQSQFITAMETALESSVQTAMGYTSGGQGDTTEQVTVDEATDGDLTSICIAWNRTTPVMEISDIAYAVVS